MSLPAQNNVFSKTQTAKTSGFAVGDNAMSQLNQRKKYPEKKSFFARAQKKMSVFFNLDDSTTIQQKNISVFGRGGKMSFQRAFGEILTYKGTVIETQSQLETSVKGALKDLGHSSELEIDMLLEAVQEKEHTEKRGTWTSQWGFIFTCLGFMIGLGNISRFPVLEQTHGGGAFMIPYAVCLVLIGMPLFCLEMMIGQYSSYGPVRMWEMNILCKGIGWSKFVLSVVLIIHTNGVIAWCFYFLFASTQNVLPWTTCGNSWNTCACKTEVDLINRNTSIIAHLQGLNCSGAIDIIKHSSEEYFFNKVLHISEGLDNLGVLRWDISACYVLVWTMLCLITLRGINNIGQTQTFFVIFSFCTLTVLIVSGMTLDGAMIGIEWYLHPDLEKLRNPRVWKDAAAQVVYSLSCCLGPLTAMASYCRFENDVVRYSIVLPLIDFFVSFSSGLALFSVLGHLSKVEGIPMEIITAQQSNSELIFVVYPAGLTILPNLQHAWSFMFFAMLVAISLSTQTPNIATILTVLQDEFPALLDHSRLLVITACVCGCLLGLPVITDGGTYIIRLFDYFIGTPLLIIGLLQVIAIVWVYGVEMFRKDMLVMVGPHGRTVFDYYMICWVSFTPGSILFIIGMDLYDFKSITNPPSFPAWAEIAGWLIVLFILIWVPVWYILRFVYELLTLDTTTEYHETAWQVFVRMNRPSKKWGKKEKLYGMFTNLFGSLSRHSTYSTLSTYSNQTKGVKNKATRRSTEHSQVDLTDLLGQIASNTDVSKQKENVTNLIDLMRWSIAKPSLPKPIKAHS